MVHSPGHANRRHDGLSAESTSTQYFDAGLHSWMAPVGTLPIKRASTFQHSAVHQLSTNFLDLHVLAKGACARLQGPSCDKPQRFSKLTGLVLYQSIRANAHRMLPSGLRVGWLAQLIVHSVKRGLVF